MCLTKVKQFSRIMSHIPEKPARYHQFILRLWQEGDGQGRWRISLQNPHTEVRIGFNTLEELMAYLDRWMKRSSNQT
jgi:hypothetical protein